MGWHADSTDVSADRLIEAAIPGSEITIRKPTAILLASAHLADGADGVTQARSPTKEDQDPVALWLPEYVGVGSNCSCCP